MRFYLGIHMPNWLGREELGEIPLFLSRVRMSRSSTWKRSVGPWALDSGGFSELSLRGKWSVTPLQYAREVKVYSLVIGKPDFAAIQDWMCEPFILQKTGLTVREHQRRTVESYLTLTSLAPGIAWLPVLQGFTLREYLSHVSMYRSEGIDLRNLPRVGVGSICRRQGTREAEVILKVLYNHNLRLHGFGFKIQGLLRSRQYLHSADSMAWSFDARRGTPLPGCKHLKCNSCIKYARFWHDNLLRKLYPCS